MDALHLRALAHDLRTPASAIEALSQLIAAHAEEPEAVRAYAKRLDAACVQITVLAQALCAPDTPHGTVLRTPKALAQEAAALFGERAAISFAGTCTREIAVDENAVLRILCNLLGNAVKYTPHNGQIALEVSADADEVCFTVRDTGIGMGKETLERLFEPYARGREAKQAGIPGTGLGLCTSRLLAREMGGEITAQSCPGEGSVLTFRLPDPDVQAMLAGKRFLVAEDSALAADALCELLEESGAQALRAEDGTQAVRLFEASRCGAFDAVLMDLQMPGMDGFEAAQAIRRLKRADARRTTLIALTGDASVEVRERAEENGADFCVLKPLSMQVLARLLACRTKCVNTQEEP